MKAICIHDCQFRGVLVKADTVLDISEAEAKLDHVKSSFRPIDGDAQKKKPSDDERDENGMSVEDYRARLTTLNVPFHPTDGIDELRKLFDRANDMASRKASRR